MGACSPQIRGPFAAVILAAAVIAVFRPAVLGTNLNRSIWVTAFVFVDVTLIAMALHPWNKMDEFRVNPEAESFFLNSPDLERYWPLSLKNNYQDKTLNPNSGMWTAPFNPATSSPLGYLRMAPRRTNQIVNLISPGYLVYKNGKLDMYDRSVPAGENPVKRENMPIVSMMNVGWFISKKVDLGYIDSLIKTEGESLWFYKNPDALARVRTVSSWRVAKSPQESLAMVGSGKIDFKRQAIIESRAGALADADFESPPPKVRIKNSRPGYWEIDTFPMDPADQDNPYFLVISETLMPGWTALVDGREAAIHYAYHAFMGVSLDPGPHQVVLFHAPAGFRIGLWTSLATLGWLILVLAARIITRHPKTGANAENPESLT